MGWRDVRKTARAVVHGTMKVPVLYITQLQPGVGLPEPVELFARIHTNEVFLGDQPGTSYNSAERVETVPKIVFWASDLTDLSITLRRGNVISVERGEAYQIDVIHPVDRDIVVTEAIRLPAADVQGIQLPARCY